jgi:hypothetical protein
MEMHGYGFRFSEGATAMMLGLIISLIFHFYHSREENKFYKLILLKMFFPCHRIDNWKREHVLQFLREKVKPTSAN